ncbi:MAG TPA: hypothetical protein VL856_19225 [Acidimicrobiia bacterium]|nr:hypothetical protein [Acidimicrobiia bacterium]
MKYAGTLFFMCANCVSKADVIVGTLGFSAYVFKDQIQSTLVAAGIIPEPHPLAKEMRTVTFLRDLDLEPAPILGIDVVEAADRALAFPPQKIYRRSFRDALALVFGVGMRSQTIPATQ